MRVWSLAVAVTVAVAVAGLPLVAPLPLASVAAFPLALDRVFTPAAPFPFGSGEDAVDEEAVNAMAGVDCCVAFCRFYRNNVRPKRGTDEGKSSQRQRGQLATDDGRKDSVRRMPLGK